MKYIIKESQVDKMINLFTEFINSEDYDGIRYVSVDYDDVMSQFVLNIFYCRPYIIKLGNGSKQTSYLVDTTNEIGKKFFLFTSHKPLLYRHFEDC
jgi:hypothetical protein